MWPYHPDLLATPVPRYTSFPTAAEFGDKVGEGDLRSALATVEGDVSLYVHIPFCEKICWYCGCNTAAANRKQRLTAYLDALHHEIALMASLLPGPVNITRIAFGGGSPNAIAPYDFVRLMDSLYLAFAPRDPVISIELDPRTLTAEWGEVVAGVGATHASMGVQTFSPRLQRAIGRVQPGEMIEQGTALLRRSGITSLNFDLMYGLPGQTMVDVGHSIERAVELGADRIALFGYAHVPHMIPRQRQIAADNLPGAQMRFAMAEFGHRLLTDEGYVAIGFDHFARPGDPMAQAARGGRLHRNFQGFTEDTAPVLLGLGASAISSFPHLLIQNEKNAGRYRMLLSQDRLPASHGVARSADDQARGAAIAELLCHGSAEIPPALAREAYDRLEPYLARGLCDYDKGRLVIAANAVPYARSIAAAFDPYRQQSARRFSSAV
ncbi:MAG: oxygen-independent coproporphyrinogen III oxidase [Sphingomonadales bacterium]|nr:oxygen-independent coproporphyrinogen III oxidase [Sphingomonadales bacterium]MBD3774082.1 oxygen-independent coproporphyrinogen III oxidase [Paracoccaceae bacterium]